MQRQSHRNRHNSSGDEKNSAVDTVTRHLRSSRHSSLPFHTTLDCRFVLVIWELQLRKPREVPRAQRMPKYNAQALESADATLRQNERASASVMSLSRFTEHPPYIHPCTDTAHARQHAIASGRGRRRGHRGSDRNERYSSVKPTKMTKKPYRAAPQTEAPCHHATRVRHLPRCDSTPRTKQRTASPARRVMHWELERINVPFISIQKT